MVADKSLGKLKVLITGGMGMIGSTIARTAIEKGAKVVILDPLLPHYGGNLFNLEDLDGTFEHVEGDIRDFEMVEALVKDVDLIFNLAAQVSYVRSNNDPLLDVDINCRGHLTLLEACRKVNPHIRIIFSSSRFVYGSIERNPVDESHPFNCLSIYGIHKLAAERYHELYHKAHGIRPTIFRIANPYGPRQQMQHGEYGILNWFIRLALEGKPLTIYGDGRQVRDYIFVQDSAEAMIAAAVEEKTIGQIYNIGSGVGTSFGEMVKIIAEIIPESEIKYVDWPKDRYFVETGDYVTDISKICAVIPWEPRTLVREGVEKTVDYYQKYRHKYW